MIWWFIGGFIIGGFVSGLWVAAFLLEENEELRRKCCELIRKEMYRERGDKE